MMRADRENSSRLEEVASEWNGTDAKAQVAADGKGVIM